MSLADKLNYTINAKLDIQKACIYQGVDLPDNAPFGDYGKYIRLLSGGGGFPSEYEFTCIAEENTMWCFYISILLLKHGIRTFKAYLDGNLIGTIDGTHISEDKNTYVTFTLSYDNPILAGIHKVKIVADNESDTAYVTEVIVSFPLSKYCQTTEGMTNISWQNDDGTNSFACPDSYKFFYYNANLVTTIWYGGNTWIGLTGGSEQITYNRRDTYVNTFYHRLLELGPLKAIKLRWDGWAPYGARDNAHNYAWEVFLFNNGDGMIVWCSDGGATSWDGSFNFLGQTYTRPTKEKPYVSFYRQNELGTQWEVDYDIYSPTKIKNLFKEVII